MKLDTSSYYPDSLLDEIEEPESMPRNPAPDDPGEQPEAHDDVMPDRCSRAVDIAATAISWIMVPLLMPLYGIILMFGLSILSFAPTGTKVIFSLLIGVITVVLPALAVMLLKKLGVIHDVGLNGREERLIPYIISIVCMCGAAWFVWSKSFPVWVVMFFAGGALAGVIELIINFRWKISVHAAGVAGIVALMVWLMREGLPHPRLIVWLIISIACAGLVGSARLWLRRHTLMQVICGYIVGFCSVYFLMLWVK